MIFGSGSHGEDVFHAEITPVPQYQIAPTDAAEQARADGFVLLGGGVEFAVGDLSVEQVEGEGGIL